MAKPSIASLVDELGKLSEQIAEARKLSKHSDEIKKLLREHADGKLKKPGDSLTLRGSRFVATVGELPPRRSIKSIAKLFRLWGEAQFLRLCSVTVGVIEENTTPAEQQQILEDGWGTTRPVTVQAK